MKKIMYILLGAVMLQSCNVKDESLSLYPKNNPNFSQITITSPTKELSVDLGKDIDFTPTVKQTVEGRELKYIWTANKYNTASKVYGDQFPCCEGPTLKFRFKDAGNYKVRLEVKNNDYSEFMTWDMAVRNYDNGYFVVGMDESGTANIAFGRTLSATDVLEGKKFEFSSDLIAAINPTHNIKDVVYIGKSLLVRNKPEAYIHIFTKDKIYTADAYTFIIIDVLDFTKTYPGEYIKSVSMCDETGTFTSTLFTSKGRYIAFKRKDFAVVQVDQYAGIFYDNAYMNLFNTSGVNPQNTEAGVDETNSKVFVMIFYYHSKPVSNTAAMINGSVVEDVIPNVYAGYDILNVMRMNGDYWEGNKMTFYTIAQKKNNPKEIKVVEFNAAYQTGVATIVDKAYTVTEDIPYKKGAPMVPNARYDCAYYPSGSKLYTWDVLNHTLPSASSPSIELGAGKEITAVTLSYDMKTLYVGFYDKNSSNALKGGVYFYDASKLKAGVISQPTEKYENITTRPVQILFKSNQQDMYRSFDDI